MCYTTRHIHIRSSLVFQGLQVNLQAIPPDTPVLAVALPLRIYRLTYILYYQIRPY
jgi:hypothetical protein